MMATVAACHAQTQLRILQGEKPVGNVVYSQKIDDEGRKTVNTRMVFGTGPSSIATVITITMDAFGNPTRKIQEMMIGTTRTKTLADFTSLGVKVVSEVKGERKVSNFPTPAGLTSSDPTQFWFLRDRPSPGTRVKFADFNLTLQKWETVETTYVGKQSVTIGDVTYKGHGLSVRRGKEVANLVVDEKGIPLTFSDSSSLRLERVP